MKSHSPLLCGAAATTKKVQKVSKSKQKADLKSLLTTLEEEFGQLSLYVIASHTVCIHVLYLPCVHVSCMQKCIYLFPFCLCPFCTIPIFPLHFLGYPFHCIILAVANLHGGIILYVCN